MLPPWTWVSRVVIVPRGASMSVLASSPWENPNHSDQDRRCWRKRCDLHSGVPPNKAIASVSVMNDVLERSCRTMRRPTCRSLAVLGFGVVATVPLSGRLGELWLALLLSLVI